MVALFLSARTNTFLEFVPMGTVTCSNSEGPAAHTLCIRHSKYARLTAVEAAIVGRREQTLENSIPVNESGSDENDKRFWTNDSVLTGSVSLCDEVDSSQRDKQACSLVLSTTTSFGVVLP